MPTLLVLRPFRCQDTNHAAGDMIEWEDEIEEGDAMHRLIEKGFVRVEEE